MLFSEMTRQDRVIIFDYPDHYPLTVTVDGETRPLDAESVAALRAQGVDFDVDERQVTLLLIENGTC